MIFPPNNEIKKQKYWYTGDRGKYTNETIMHSNSNIKSESNKHFTHVTQTLSK